MDLFQLSNHPTLLGFELFQWLADAVVGAAMQAFKWAIEFILKGTTLNIGGAAFATQMEAMKTIGLYAVVPFIVIAVIAGIVRGSLSEVLRTITMGALIAVVGVPATMFISTLLQMIDRSMTNAVLGVSASQSQLFIDRFTSIDLSNTGPGPLLLMFGLGVFLFFGVICLYAELLLRDVMIMMITLFMPLALAAGIWRPTRAFLVRMIETLIVVIFARTIAIGVLFLGMAMCSESFSLTSNAETFAASDQGYMLMLAGMLTVMLAAMQLPLLLSFFAGQGVYSQVGARQEYERGPFSPSQGKTDARAASVKAIRKGGQAFRGKTS